MTDITSTIAKGVPQRSLLPAAEARQRLRRRRQIKDSTSKWGISVAGFGVVAALATIFIYLFYEVAPILRGAKVTPESTLVAPPVAGALTQALFIERYEELGLQYSDDGQVSFFQLNNGDINTQLQLTLPEGASITSFAATEPGTQTVAQGLLKAVETSAPAWPTPSVRLRLPSTNRGRRFACWLSKAAPVDAPAPISPGSPPTIASSLPV
jgi:phosphate transport system permease protein